MSGWCSCSGKPLSRSVAEKNFFCPNRLLRSDSMRKVMTNSALENGFQEERYLETVSSPMKQDSDFNRARRGKKTPLMPAATSRGMASKPMGKRLYTLKEAAQYLGRSEWGMRDLIWAGKIPVVREEGGRKIFIDINDLVEYVERNKTVYH